MKTATILTLIALLVPFGQSWDPNWWDNRNTIVHLFEWPFSDIAAECERFLAPKGYAGVQVNISFITILWFILQREHLFDSLTLHRYTDNR